MLSLLKVLNIDYAIPSKVKIQEHATEVVIFETI